MKLDDVEMTEGVVDAIVVHVSGDVVGMGFDNIGSIVHSDAEGGVAEHGDVVASITNANGFRNVNAIVPDDMVDAGIFAYS